MPSLPEWFKCECLPIDTCNKYRSRHGLPPLKDAPCNEWDVTQRSRGLGDTAAKLIHRATFGKVKPCGGCKKRQTSLNRVMPYRPTEQPPLSAVPFDRPVVRDLIYHCWPVARNGVWQANLDQLLNHISLFNGRRVMAVVTSPDADAPEAVQEYLKGADFEFIVRSNNKSRRECETFLQLLERIATTDAYRVFFYAHAKGVRHGSIDNRSTTVHRWTSAMYETCLGSWPEVKAALINHAFAGSFRRFGQFKTPGNHRWHFSGTFWWARSMHVFSQDWRQLDNRFFGVEAWPGRMVSANRSACLFLDNCGDLYKRDYWERHVEPELRLWKTSRSGMPSSTE